MIDIDLFAGGGGLAVGLNHAGFGPMHMYEFEGYSCKTLRRNLQAPRPTVIGVVHQSDVRCVKWTTLDAPVGLLAAGAPCQPFSMAGNHRSQSDPRNLFPEILRAARALRPQVVLLENVRGLARNNFSDYFGYIRRQLECPSIEPRPEEPWANHDRRLLAHQRGKGYEPEYHVSYAVLNAADYGVPQQRLRVFVVAARNDLPVFAFPRPTHSRDALVRAQQSGTYWAARNIRSKRVLVPERLGADDDGLLPWVTVRDALSGLPRAAPCEGSARQNHWRIPGAKVYLGHTGSVMDWPSKTIKAGVHGVPGGENTVITDRGGIRYFTLRETAELQTFPYDYYFEGDRTHVTKQIGNAVPCRLAEAVARPLRALLDRHSQRVTNIGHPDRDARRRAARC